ncbi:hypothetical protein CTT30_22555 (plasmid) [Vibrio coralliilyticus]|nr:hypothetical protein CTT30_22555 [Vibrio coralliilyticus]
MPAINHRYGHGCLILESKGIACDTMSVIDDKLYALGNNIARRVWGHARFRITCKLTLGLLAGAHDDV